MKIEKVVSLSKQKFRVITDEQPAFVLYKGEVARFHIKENEELPEETFHVIQDEVLTRRAKMRALHLLTVRDYTRSELIGKLEKSGYTPVAVQRAAEYVESYHYLDDARFASSYTNCHKGKKSAKQIEFELKKKGVSREVIQSCVELSENDESDAVRSILKKRCPHPELADRKEIQKQYMYLAGRGFASDTVWEILGEYFEHFS